jgi:hypothetical protein
LFYGYIRPEDIVKCFSYQQIAQWELLHATKDFVTHITNNFFKEICILIHQVLSCDFLYAKESWKEGKKVVKDIECKNNLDNLLKSLIAYRSLKIICTSLDYFENVWKNVFVLIQQLGPPIFFVTFTNVEHLRKPLCHVLQEFKNKDSDELEDSIYEDTIDSLIMKHIFICSQYYKHRFTTFKSLLLTIIELFGEVAYDFFIAKF